MRKVVEGGVAFEERGVGKGWRRGARTQLDGSVELVDMYSFSVLTRDVEYYRARESI